MNRHHPYGGAYDYPQPRRGTNSPVPGHDRGHRFQDRGGPYRGRGGHHRGRGGYSNNYDSGMNHPAPYDQGPSQQGDMPPYNDYEAPYYQGSYADTASFGPPAGYPGYPKYEDGPVYEDPEPRGNRQRPIRRERDDTVHDSIIEERIQRERPCRTLFIRNIKASGCLCYETNSDDIRRQFEEHGDIKTFFDLISTRGMVFVTYYDLRAAERAKEKLQGSEISGRPIDVHYSLPRDDAKGADREKNQQFQGTLHVTLRSSPSGQIDDSELHRVFQSFGDIRSIKPVGDRIDSRYVEFFDMRAALDAADRLRHQPLQDGMMDIAVAWDNNEGGPPHAGGPGSGGGRDWEDRGHHHRGGGGGGGGRGRGRGRGGRGRHDDYDDRRDRRRDDFGGGRNGRYDDDRGGRGGGGYDRYGPPPPDRYGPPPGSAGAPSHYPPPHMPVVPPASNLDVPPVVRLEQAKKVQELLAALKPDSAAPAVPAPTAQPGPYYPPPPPAAYPPPSAYTGVPSNPLAQPPAATNPSLAGLPPGILALLQNAQSQVQSSVPPAAYGAPPAVGVTPPASTQPPPNPTQYGQYMSYFQNPQGGKQ